MLKGRLTSEFLNLDNPEIPYIKEDGKFVEASWEKALEIEGILDKLNKNRF